MPRKSIQHFKDHFYLITICSHHPDHFYVSPLYTEHTVKKILHELETELQIEVVLDVTSINRVLIILKSPIHPLSKVMFFFMTRLTRKMQREAKRINRVLGGKYKGCLITEFSELELIKSYLRMTTEIRHRFFSPEEIDSIECGMKKSVFRFKKDNGTGKYIYPTSCFRKSMLAPDGGV